MIPLGATAQDTITGFSGVVVGHLQWLFGTRRVALQSREMREGKPIEPVWFDEAQIHQVGADTVATLPSGT